METLGERIKRMTHKEILQQFSSFDLWFYNYLPKGGVANDNLL